VIAATYSVAQMREAEARAAAEHGISLWTLMRRAGEALASAAVGMLASSTGPVWVFCGAGNNGGDGYVCATELRRRGLDVTVCGVGAYALAAGTLAKQAVDLWLAAGGAVRPATDSLTATSVEAGLVVDALLGTGLSRDVGGVYAHLIDVVNGCGAPVLACDVPSGVDADTGRVMGRAVKAARTVMMGLAKPAAVLPPGREHCGVVEVADIGLPPAVVNGL